MKKIRLVASILLALSLLFFGLNYFIDFLPQPTIIDESPGMQMLNIMRDNGMMVYMALSHILIGILLLYPKSNYAAALLQLPISIGIVIFHLTLMPVGIEIGLIILLLNIVILWNTNKLNNLFS